MSAIDRLKELHEKATPGPWEAHDGGWNGSSVCTPHRKEYVMFTVEKHEDAQLIAEMRSNMAKLLGYIEKLEGAVNQIEVYGNAPLAAEWQLLKWRYLEARKAKDEL